MAGFGDISQLQRKGDLTMDAARALAATYKLVPACGTVRTEPVGTMAHGALFAITHDGMDMIVTVTAASEADIAYYEERDVSRIEL